MQDLTETTLSHEDRIYQRIGEFVVSFQWIENRLREIGWFILDPQRIEWPPKGLRNLTNEKLIDKVQELFMGALPKCKLPSQLETDYRNSFASTANVLHELRRDRNRILHSAFLELKAGGKIQELVRSNTKFLVDEEIGESLFDQDVLSPESFAKEMKMMADAAVFLNRAYLQLIHRHPNDDTQGQKTDTVLT